MSKGLEAIIINKISTEISGNMCENQHGFIKGKPKIMAMDDTREWINESPSRHVLGALLDIMGAFDNVKWITILEYLTSLGASFESIELIRSYLTNRRIRLNIEGNEHCKMAQRECPRGSRLGSFIWNVVMDAALRIPHDSNCKEKTQILNLKGGKKPGVKVTLDGYEVLTKSPVIYLGVFFDSRWSFYHYLEYCTKKSTDMYSRFRGMTSANWGIRAEAAFLIYKSVFLPRITYASTIWLKPIKLLGSCQIKPLLGSSGAYRTTSTDALQSISGILPLDLEIRVDA